ncbi:hypothetical protein TVAG_171460 [Trichomonas vaginalis G3]|uniref:Uncharacterized protein n=1 Tax=Trichomonas vaginalis (strain ATCC PRA-98 / G3) TaxID=412133 RepID=A2FZK8_TRIV3|nr:hypothetical protein TVAGG3_0792040 [Trichomonas vaginalis G3]EAX89666.1 hypothetical protein TVAG_171460 [Trichomonas vaginalis G3]KAI5495866.1 hypothetical protein TVAGG3_0792040 [Trichomonas vaginalis G3]|eukprot:XP_001302596.1 hypothetical protein [Trichomonas vaginalis G3]
MKDRLSTLRKKASLGNKELPQLTPPNYNNDTKLSGIYNQYASINRKIAAVNKKLGEIQVLVEKEHTYTNNADIYRSKNLVSKHLNLASVMMEEITKDIKDWRSKTNTIHSKPVKSAQDIIELAFFEAAINAICDCL